MATEVAAGTGRQTDSASSPHTSTRQALLIGVAAFVLFAAGTWLRLHNLGLGVDRDSYDEGVYWQTLRAMSAGHPLYEEVFYSQPPFFVFSVFPFYTLFGQTLWSARLGIVALSSLGLLGAFLLGKTFGGRLGALGALLLIVVDPLYLAESQTLQAEAPSAALSLLAVALAYLWWERPDGLAGLGLAIGAGIALSLGILCKLTAVSALVPVGLLVLAHLWRSRRRPSGRRWAGGRSLLAGVAAFVATTALVLAPLNGALPELWRGVVTFHIDAAASFTGDRAQNLTRLRDVLSTLAIGYASLYGIVAAALRRDWRVLPLAGWLLATVLLLWRQTPLFDHHFLTLVPPLIALAAAGIGPIALRPSRAVVFQTALTGIAIAIVLVVSAENLRREQAHFEADQETRIPVSESLAQVAGDLQAATRPEQLVITDAQFIAGLANRSTPAWLVDTSEVRISTGYVTAQRLIEEASRPEVQAVLLYSGRLSRPEVAAFSAWVARHFQLARSYGEGKALWVRASPYAYSIHRRSAGASPGP